MKQCMKFNIYGQTVAVYFNSVTETYLIYQLVGRKKVFIDEEDWFDDAARTALNFIVNHA